MRIKFEFIMSSKQTEQTATLSKPSLTEINTSTVFAFTAGVLVKEIYTFISEGGLSGDYPLSKSLFVMVLCIITLALLAVPRFLEVESTVEALKKLEIFKFLETSNSNNGTRA
jgi:hypothetical protein